MEVAGDLFVLVWQPEIRARLVVEEVVAMLPMVGLEQHKDLEMVI